MSFIYAFNNKTLSIMSDTKIGLNDDLLNLWETESERRLVQQLGLMKSIIVSPNIVICYAGNNISKAAELLRKVSACSYDLEVIINLACDIHTNSKEDDIEFIIAYCNEEARELISIKNRQVYRECKAAWLGSWDAYNEFKRLESQIKLDNKDREKMIDCEAVEKQSNEEVDELLKNLEIEKCFSTVVNSGIDPLVGGMVVRVNAVEGENAFQYMAAMNAISSNWPQKVQPGECIKFYQGADRGSYCCNIYQSSHNFCCYVYEDHCGIVYTDDVSYVKDLEGMRFPQLYKVDKKTFDYIAKQNGAYSCIDIS